ncbi:MAG: RsmE family RNA methyltransferase [Opitutales bacterium]
MNLILFAEQQARYTLSARDPRFEHVRGVLRMGVGEDFIVAAVNGPRGKATIADLNAGQMDLSVVWEAQPMPPPPPIELLLAIPRPATARKVLFDATTLGVRTFHFFAAEKGDPAYAKSGLWTADEWRATVWRGAEQAFNSHLPEVRCRGTLGGALAELPTGGTRWALDVYEAEGHLAAGEPPRLPLVLALGGERGWSRRERETLRTAGFELRGLGPRVLRVETAVTAALAVALGRMEAG